ncbi:MAG: metal-sensitive transcriptional regulator [Candidatus Nanopelagicales bacterium]
MAKSRIANQNQEIDSYTLQDEVQLKVIIKRITRAPGHLGAVSRLLAEGKDCVAVITQIAAVSKAINSAAFMLISSSLKECMIEGERDTEEVSAKLQKLFLSLA